MGEVMDDVPAEQALVEAVVEPVRGQQPGPGESVGQPERWLAVSVGPGQASVR